MSHDGVVLKRKESVAPRCRRQDGGWLAVQPMKQQDDGQPLSQFFTHEEERPAFDRLGTQAAQEAVCVEAVGQKLCDAVEGGRRGGRRLNLYVVGEVREVCKERS
eukprot:13420602-Ditylum_brightwellii.AAC.1